MAGLVGGHDARGCVCLHFPVGSANVSPSGGWNWRPSASAGWRGETSVSVSI